MSINIGQNDYRLSGRERLQEVLLLLSHEKFAGAVYLAGRAVEAILRAMLWRYDPQIRFGDRTLDTGHDLRLLLERVKDLGVLTNESRRVLYPRIARLWSNNMRFVPSSRLEKLWWRLGEIDRRRTLKWAVREYYDLCCMVVEHLEALYDEA